MTKKELINLLKDMPDNATIYYSPSFYDKNGDYQGHAYFVISNVKQYEGEEQLKDCIFLQ